MNGFDYPRRPWFERAIEAVGEVVWVAIAAFALGALLGGALVAVLRLIP